MTDKTAKTIAFSLFGLGVVGSIYSIMNKPNLLLPEDKRKVNVAVASYTLLGLGGGLVIGLLSPASTLIKAQA